MNNIRDETEYIIETEEEIISQINCEYMSLKDFMNKYNVKVEPKTIYNYVEKYLESINENYSIKNFTYECDFMKITTTQGGYRKYYIKNDRLFQLKILKERKIDKSKKDLQNILGIHTPLRERVSQPCEYWRTDSGFRIPKHYITLLGGDGGVGKTYGTIHLSCELRVKENAKIFSWYSEDELGLSKYRFEQTFKVLGYTEEQIEKVYENVEVSDSVPLPLRDRKKNSSLIEPTEYLERLKDYCVDKDIIIIDPLVRFLGGVEENHGGQTRMFMDMLTKWIREEQKTLILIHHVKKLGKDTEIDNERFRGSSRFTQRTRLSMIATFAKDKEGNDIKHMRKFTITKDNNSPKNDFMVQLWEKEDKGDDFFNDNGKKTVEYDNKISYQNISKKDKTEIEKKTKENKDSKKGDKNEYTY